MTTIGPPRVPGVRGVCLPRHIRIAYRAPASVKARKARREEVVEFRRTLVFAANRGDVRTREILRKAVNLLPGALKERGFPGIAVSGWQAENYFVSCVVTFRGMKKDTEALSRELDDIVKNLKFIVYERGLGEYCVGGYRREDPA